MAILMVYDRDNTHRDPEKEAAGCYKRGYVVEVFEDDKKLIEPPFPPFLFVKVKGLSRDDAMKKYMEPEYGKDFGVEGEPLPIVRRRAVKIDFDLLDSKDADEFSKSRVVSFAKESDLRMKAVEIKTGKTLSTVDGER